MADPLFLVAIALVGVSFFALALAVGAFVSGIHQLRSLYWYHMLVLIVLMILCIVLLLILAR